jgi:hypothetical protein
VHWQVISWQCFMIAQVVEIAQSLVTLLKLGDNIGTQTDAAHKSTSRHLPKNTIIWSFTC